MSSEHVEVLWAMLRKCVNERLARKSADREAAALAAAIEALKSAPQPPAEAQPVAWEWEYIGGDHYPRGHKVARSLREMDPTNPPYPETWRSTRPLIYGDSPPPSEPVGDSLVQTALRNLPQYISKSGLVGPDKHSAMQCFEVLRDALAQQPAAVDEARARLFCLAEDEISSGTLDDLIDEAIDSDIVEPGDTLRVEEWVRIREFEVGPEDDERLAAQQGGGTDER